jgi:sarcosine oxidase subunit beta
VAWGYARACADMGMDIIEQCEVKGVTSANGVVTGVQTTRGDIACGKLAIVVAGHSSVLAEMAASASPSNRSPSRRSSPSPIKPCMDVVVMANTVHGYMSQSDKGEMVIGGGTDGYNAYTSAAPSTTSRRRCAPSSRLSHHLAAQDAAAVGRDRGHDRRPLAHPIQDPAGQLLRQLRLGHGAVQGHPGLGLGHGRARGQGGTGPLAAAFGPRTFREGASSTKASAAGVAH